VLDRSGSVARIEREYARSQRGSTLRAMTLRFAALVEALTPRRNEAAQVYE
jgi:hypothetical protein